MKVLIIGGTVFIGEAIARRLLSEWHDVCLFHRGSAPNDLPLAKEIGGDRNAPDDLFCAIRDFKPDAIVDMIAMTPTAAETARRAVEQAGFTGNYLLISSCDVYAQFGEVLGTEEKGAGGEGGAIFEDSPVRTNLFPYRGKGAGDWAEEYDKILVEEELLGYRGTCILRLPMVYGPRDKQRRIGTILDALASDKDPEPVVSWHWRSCYGFVENVAAAASKLLSYPSAGGATLHLQDGSPTQLELWQTVARLADLPMPEIDLTGDDEDRPPDISLATVGIDEAAPMWMETPFEEAIRLTIESGTG